MRGLVHLVRLFVEAFFGGGGVPPSHVWVGEEVAGVTQCVVYTSGERVPECVAEDALATKSQPQIDAEKHGLRMYIQEMDKMDEG
ncbi:hypothetical protein IT571_05235 [Candidatus Sumerlaeota bacterium]|nr:hypothetical protein [Candidatus Sumerlaeota bacterium]